MSNAQSIPTPTAPVQIADAPDAAFRGPFFEINPDAGPTMSHHAAAAPRPLHLTETSVAALATPVAHAHAPAVCPPAPANSSVPSIEIHEPPAGQTVEISVTPNQPLTFDFNPLDAKAVVHGDDLTLTFADGGVLVLHHISDHGMPLATSLQLPDGTIINPCELLQALPEDQVNPTAGPNDKIPQPNPAAGPEQPNPAAGPGGGAHPVVSPFDIPGFGPGLTPLGALPPEGFNTGNEFPPPGNGGFPPTVVPPTPPFTPPGPPGTVLTVIEDSQFIQYPGTSVSGDLNTDTYFNHPIVSSDPSPVHVDSYVFWEPGSVAIDPATDPAGTAAGMWGTLQMQPNGSYTYTLNATGIATASQLGSDFLSEALGNPPAADAPYPLLDLFTFTVDNGSETASQQLALYTVGTAIMPNETTAAVSGTNVGAHVLLTFTDLADPAHSFQEVVTIGSNGLLTADGAPIQPQDPGLVTLEYQGATTTINSLTVGGETMSGLNLTLDGSHQALTAIIDPDLSSFGDPGDTGSIIIAPTAYTNVTGDFAATAAGQYVYETTGAGANLSVASGSDADHSSVVLNLGANTVGSETGGLGSDVLVYNDNSNHITYNGGAGVVVGGTPTEAGTLTFFVDNASLAGGSDHVTINVTNGESDTAMATALANAINGDVDMTAIGLSASSVAAGGDSFQLIQTGTSLTSQTTFEELAQSTSDNPPAESIGGQGGIDTLRLDTGGNSLDLTHDGGSQFANVQVIDLTAAAAGSAAINSVSLDASSVLQLTANENSAIKTYGGADAMWVNGTANDSVTLNGFTQISSAITSPSESTATANSTSTAAALSSPSQMVGFAEYSGAVNGQTVHVYVANAIVNAGHVTTH